MTITRLSVTPNTRLQTVFRVVGPDGVVTWQVWTACHNRNAPLHEMLGTFMQLNADGSATRVTYRPDDTVHEFECLPAYKDKHDAR